MNGQAQHQQRQGSFRAPAVKHRVWYHTWYQYSSDQLGGLTVHCDCASVAY
jgi:hypothetical protein